jgi:hypothetical protein
MSVSFLSVLTAKRQAVVEELDAIRRNVAELTAQLAVKEGQLRNLDDLISLEGGAKTDPPAGGNGTAPLRPAHFLDEAHDLLGSIGQPVHYRTLAQRLSEGGVYVPGQDPAANLLTQMSRDVRFARAGGRGMYGLADWPSVQTSRGQKSATAKPTTRARRPSRPARTKRAGGSTRV